jgi:hypothetical protein
MTIRQKTLEQRAEKCVIVMQGERTLAEALSQLGQKQYRLNETYLVVTSPNEPYRVTLLADMAEAIRMLGYDGFNQPLGALPIPPAGQVVPVNTPQSGQEIVDWVDTHPRSMVVVTDEEGGFVGLFVNPNRSGGGGLFDLFSLFRLHGETGQEADARAKVNAQVAVPVCQYCHHQDFFKIDLATRSYICKSCNQRQGI